jgi:hypothetical protein
MASIAQKYLEPFSFLSSPEYQALSESDKPRAIEMFKSADPAGQRLIDWAIEQNTPEARQKLLEQQLICRSGYECWSCLSRWTPSCWRTCSCCWPTLFLSKVE